MQETKIYCDRCKRELKSKTTAIIIDVLKGNWYKPLEVCFDQKVEFCEDCLKEFKSFMNYATFHKSKQNKKRGEK